MTAEAPRAMCARCRRPEVVCYCRFVTEIATRTRVVILQHPRERDVPINTARIASLCLPDAEVHVGVNFAGTPALARALGDPLRPAALLYPGEGAIDVEGSPPSGPITLVVVDGTWWQARKLVRSNPQIAALPRYAFRPTAPSNYRIRKEPQDDYVSTLEALVHVLSVLEGDRTRFDAMLTPFRAMVDAQLAFAERTGGSPRMLTRRRRPRADPRMRLPALLRERKDDLVCVFAEANGWPYGHPERRPEGDEIVQWVAHRLGTGETFDALVAPLGKLAPGTPRHLGIDATAIEGGITRAELLTSWARFTRPSDVLCSWGTYTPDLLARSGGEIIAPHVDLRNAARVFAIASVGTIEAFRASLGAERGTPFGRGRAGERLADLVAIARTL